MIDFEYVWKLTLRDTDISEHLLTLYSLAVIENAKTVLEIGAGQSTYALTAAVNATGGQFYSIDLTKEARERLFSDAVNLDFEPRYHFIKGNSVDTPDIKGVEWNKPIDFLFIDSEHTYNTTFKELEKYTPFVKKNGFICMHDTGENNNVFVECRMAMLDFIKTKEWKFKTLNNQNGLTIIRKT